MISIIVPIYNKEKYLRRCIESIINQSYANLEVILINDGSTDNSLKICKEYESDSRIKVIDKMNGGVSEARNIGIKSSHGEKILFIDADDYIENDYVEKISEFNEDLVICGYYMEKDGKRTVMNSYDTLLSTKSDIHKKVLDKKYIKLLVTPYLKLFKRDIIEKFNIEFEKNISYGEDACFVFDYVYHCESLRFISYCGYINEILDGTLSRKYVKNIDTQTNYLNKRIDKFKNDFNLELVEYWKYRNLKIILYNERVCAYKHFNDVIKKNYNKVIASNDYFSKFDRILLFLLNNKMNLIVYFIYHYLRK